MHQIQENTLVALTLPHLALNSCRMYRYYLLIFFSLLIWYDCMISFTLLIIIFCARLSIPYRLKFPSVPTQFTIDILINYRRLRNSFFCSRRQKIYAMLIALDAHFSGMIVCDRFALLHCILIQLWTQCTFAAFMSDENRFFIFISLKLVYENANLQIVNKIISREKRQQQAAKTLFRVNARDLKPLHPKGAGVSAWCLKIASRMKYLWHMIKNKKSRTPTHSPPHPADSPEKFNTFEVFFLFVGCS